MLVSVFKGSTALPKRHIPAMTRFLSMSRYTATISEITVEMMPLPESAAAVRIFPALSRTKLEMDVKAFSESDWSFSASITDRSGLFSSSSIRVFA